MSTILSFQLLVATFLGGHIDRHAIYISTIKIHCEATSGNISIQVKIFSDDLQNDIRHRFALKELPSKEDLCEFEEKEWLYDYFTQHLQFWINGKLQSFRITDCVIINDVHLISFNIPSPTSWQNIKVKANYLMELYPTQSNMLQLIYSDGGIPDTHNYFGRMTNGKEYLEFSLP